ncbi:uncharacterized protein LOC143153844 [Ptiloglossa arizonensis]|uniref:uncharacterized protein LOC143153844 n=1 Tax=Ptiloglossa arizonensis TaxID=3350558 RepID=UPI003FA130C9
MVHESNGRSTLHPRVDRSRSRSRSRVLYGQLRNRAGAAQWRRDGNIWLVITRRAFTPATDVFALPCLVTFSIIHFSETKSRLLQLLRGNGGYPKLRFMHFMSLQLARPVAGNLRNFREQHPKE